jgi:hypothetical protein
MRGDWGLHCILAQVDPSNPPTGASLDYVRFERYNDATGKMEPSWEDPFDSLDTARWQVADWSFPFAVTQFSPSNVHAEGGQLNIDFKRA